MALIGGLSAPRVVRPFGSRRGSGSCSTVRFPIGTLVGLELPLLMRMLKDRLEFKDIVSRVLTFDYIGALRRA